MPRSSAAPYLCSYCRAACDGSTPACPNCGAPLDPPGGVRASDADRDRTISKLTDDFQAGRLTTEEFDERSGRALRARTQGDLATLLADLPPDLPPDRAPVTDRVTGAGRVRRRLPGGLYRIWVVIVIVIALVVSGDHNHHSLVGLVPAVAVLLFVLARRARPGRRLGEGGGRWLDRDLRRDDRDLRRDGRQLRRDEQEWR